MAQFENNDHVPTSFGEQKFKEFLCSLFSSSEFTTLHTVAFVPEGWVGVEDLK